MMRGLISVQLMADAGSSSRSHPSNNGCFEETIELVIHMVVSRLSLVSCFTF